VASVAKLAWSESLKRARDLGPELLGPAGTLVFDDAPDGGRTIAMTLSVPSASIAGGSDEIQRNVIAERSLGLPKDVAVDRDRPWNEVPR
jgi:alkylation response protein AidB-like acyl-CoA dehydrogenase